MNDSDTQSLTSVGSQSSTIRLKKYFCDYEGCSKAYNRPSLLEQHQRKHTGERPFPCSYPDCNKSFLRKSHLDAHVISHSREKPYHCSFCGKGVNTAQHLKRHEVTHTKSFKCTFDGCDESFYKHQSLRHHILSVHEKTLTCQQCDKTFTRPYKLAQHKLKHHGESPAYQCDQPGCFSNFKTWSALQFHMKQEHPKLKCPKCDKGCVGKKGLQSHMLSHDEASKAWQCKYCDVGKFSKKMDLVLHYNQFHDGNLPGDLAAIGEKVSQKNYKIENNMSELNKLDDVTPSLLRDGKQMQNQKQGSLTNSNLDVDSDLDNFTKTEVRSELGQAHKSVTSLNTSLLNGKSIIKLIHDDLSKKLVCPKPKCGRAFSRDYDLQRHLKWHAEKLQRIEQFLDGLPKEEELAPDQFEKLEPPTKKIKHNNNSFENSDDDHHEFDESDNAFDQLLEQELNGAVEEN